MLKYGTWVRNSVMSTYRPPEQCFVPCAGQRQPRTHRPQPCIHRPPSPGRKLLVAFHRLRSVEFRRRPPLRVHMYLSRKRTPHSQSRWKRKRKRQESGRRHCTIIRARCVDAPHCLFLTEDERANSSDFTSCDLCRRRAICIYKKGRGYS